MTISIDADMDLLHEQIHALRQLDTDSRAGPVSEARRYDLSIRWGAAMAGRLRRLGYYSALGRLADADEDRFQVLRRDLTAVSELIDRFGLARPVPEPSSWRPALARRRLTGNPVRAG